MKKLIFAVIACCSLYTVEAQLKTPAPSPAQTIRQDFGLGNIELSYSRPSMKGRKIFGDLVPYGKVWRTGANQATTINFSEDVTIGGKLVKAGKYGLVTIPEKKTWTVIITKQLDATSPTNYKQDMDVTRLEIKTIDLDESRETFTMQFANIKSSSIDLRIMWDKTGIAIPISTEVDTKVMAQIDQVMNKDNRPYFAAAMYYMDNGKDLNQALTWFDKAVENNPKAFWIHHQRANALAKLGKKTEAKAAAETSKSLAVEQKNDDYVKLNEKLIAELDK